MHGAYNETRQRIQYIYIVPFLTDGYSVAVGVFDV
jgi:hypothetical protein